MGVDGHEVANGVKDATGRGNEGANGVKGVRGGLTLVGTPIGNLGDLSPRAVEALRAADTVCAEDTRVSGKLLAAFGVKSHLERCDENVIADRAPQLVARMQAGERVAFVSDAGMPAVADPGARLVDACLDAGVPVDVVPGPSAVTCAIAGAGFACEAFYFGGFLPRRDAERDRLLASLAFLPAVLAFYESPHRTAASLAAMARVYPTRRVALCRELTKLHQEVLRGPAAEVAEKVAARGDLKGEVVLLVDAPSAGERDRIRRAQVAGVAPMAGAAGTLAAGGTAGALVVGALAAGESDQPGAAFDLDAAIRAGLAEGAPKSALAKQLAARTGMKRGDVYDRIQQLAADEG